MNFEIAFLLSFMLNLALAWLVVRLLSKKNELENLLKKIAKDVQAFAPKQPKQVPPKAKSFWRLKDQ